MLVRVLIKPDGTVVNEVVDRQNHLCSTVYQMTRSLGPQLSDEDIGPECDTAMEVQSE